MSATERDTAASPPEPLNMIALIAFLLLGFMVILLRVRKFPTLYEFVRRCPVRMRFYSSKTANAEQIISAVRQASIWLPVRTMCLVYSAAQVVLLRNHAVPADLVIGVKLRPFEGHAWVESKGEVLGSKVDKRLYVVLDRF